MDTPERMDKLDTIFAMQKSLDDVRVIQEIFDEQRRPITR